MAVGRPRDRQKEMFWRGTVRRQAGSGLSVRAWCERHELREATFYWWRAELARRDDGAVTFVPVRITADATTGGAGRIEIELSGGRRITVIGRVDRGALADVLAVVEERAC
jgi:hypothetical protein